MRDAFSVVYEESQKILNLDPEVDDVEPDHSAVCDLIRKEMQMRSDAGEDALMSVLGTKDADVLHSVNDQILAEIPDIYVAYERRN